MTAIFKLEPEHIHIDPDRDIDAALINSKGFGGNNATGVVISPTLTHRMLQKRYGHQEHSAYRERNEYVREQIIKYDKETIQHGVSTVYKYGEGVVEGEELAP